MAAFRQIFRHPALNFFAMHKALLQNFALSDKKSSKKSTRG